MHVEEGSYGNAILTRLPVRLIQATALPSLTLTKVWKEKRIATYIPHLGHCIAF
jgi:endonuclease/exonuclease/phosphatase family metal-dependent hydrolase